MSKDDIVLLAVPAAMVLLVLTCYGLAYIGKWLQRGAQRHADFREENAGSSGVE